MTGSPDLDAARAAVADFDRADAECARLAWPDDHGSGERTARLAALAAWEAARERALDIIEATTGSRDVDGARAMIAAERR